MTRRQAPAVDYSGSVLATLFGTANKAVTLIGLAVLVFLPFVLVVTYPWLLLIPLAVALVMYANSRQRHQRIREERRHRLPR